MGADPKVLYIDIEMAPNIVYAWRLFSQYITPDQVVEPAYPICFAAQWAGERHVQWYSVFDKRLGVLTDESRAEMVNAAYSLLDDADIVIHYNGTSFDLPWLNGEFVTNGLGPPSPYKQIDLLNTVRKRFNFPSTKLGYLAEQLGLDGKVKHEGLSLWHRCLQGDPKAWAKMEKYNKRDVTLLGELYAILRPWVPSHPSYAAFTGATVCPACGGKELVRRGYAYTHVSKFVKFRCKTCGTYSRATHRQSGAGVTAVTT